MEKVFVTGATGFVGSWLVDRLLTMDIEVIALVHDYSHKSELIRTGNISKVHAINGSIEDYLSIERAINEYEPDTVIHLAAQPIVGMSLRNPLHTFDTNIRGTYNLLDACRRYKNMIKAIVVASSDKAYGESDKLPYTEETRLSACYPYEVSKSCADMLAYTYYVTYDLPVAIMRCANIYGGGDFNWSRIIPGTIKSLYYNRNPVIRSDGKFLRDYIYVQDVISAIINLVHNIDVAKGDAFNFGMEESISVLDVVGDIQRLMGKEYLEPEIQNIVTKEIKDQWLSSEKAHKILDWNHQYTLNMGLSMTVDWYDKYFWRADNVS